MNTIKMYRASGKPIDPTDMELYLKDLNEEMDKLEEKYGKPNVDNAVFFQNKMADVDKKLYKTYPRVTSIPFPTTEEEMEELCKEYGSVAFCMEDDSLVLYILDA